MKTIRTLLLLIVLLLVVDGVGAYYLVSNNTIKLNFGNSQNLNIATAPGENANLNESVIDQNQNLNSDSSAQPTVSNCTTMDCIFSLAENCQRGEVLYEMSIPFPFEPLTTYSTRARYEILGIDNDGNCAFTEQILAASITATPENRGAIIAKGMTAEEFDSQLQMMNDSYKEVGNQINNCKGTSENVATYLKNVSENKGGTSSCNLSIGKTTCILDPDINCEMTKLQNHSNPNCSLSTGISELELVPNLGMSVGVTGFKETDAQLNWIISNPSIASISASTGAEIMVAGLKAGSAELKVTDNAVGTDCYVTIPVTVN